MNVSVYAGISNGILVDGEFQFGRGVVMRPTYAHLMSHPVMAFSPAPPGKAHPAPWRPASGGFSYDIEIELEVPDNIKLPGGLDCDETVWLLAALIRLSGHPYLMIPTFSDQSFSAAAMSGTPPILRPFETDMRTFQPGDREVIEISEAELEWVKLKWESTANLFVANPKFKAALQAWDYCNIHGRMSSALLAIWGGIEDLFSPSKSELRFRVSSNLAAYLKPPGIERYELYKKISKLYGERSKAAHSAAKVETAPMVQSFFLLQDALLRIIETENVPSSKDLEKSLFCVDINT